SHCFLAHRRYTGDIQRTSCGQLWPVVASCGQLWKGEDDMFKRKPLAMQIALLTACSVSAVCAGAAFAQAEEPLLEEIVVWGQQSVHRAAASHPSSMLTPEDLVSINVATTEDVVKFEPSLVIRRRFIGDSNGTMGMRGANMFQTSRSMVFADGVPLHYLLQSRWNGAPRWTMVSA